MRLDEIDQPIKKVVFTFGRMNPPHYGHGGVIKTLQTVAKQEGAHWYLFLSSKVEPAKNPLTYDQKCYWVKALFPETAGHLIEDASIKNPLIAATWLYKQGFRQATFVAGEDDMASYATMIKSGNEHGRKNPDAVKMGKGFYFEKLDFAISPRLTTATKSRESVTNNDPESFARNILGGKVTNPKLLAAVEKQLFPLVRKGMQLESINEDADEDERHAFMMRPENQKDTPISNALKNYTPLGDVGKIGSAISKGEYGKAILPAAQLATNLIPGKAAATAASTAIGISRGLTDESEELNKRTPNVRELARKYATEPAHIHHELNKGVKVEFEHTNDIEVATEIAMDHLGEKLDYYTRLAKVEEEDDDAVAVPGEPVSAAMDRMNARPDDQSKADFLGSYMKSALGQGGFTDGRFAQHTNNLKKKLGEIGSFAFAGGPGGNADGSNLIDRQVAMYPWDIQTPHPKEIDEVADQPYRFISPVSTATTQKSMFQTDSGTTIQVFIQVDTGNGVADIGFFDATDKENPTIGVTGKGDAFRVFATVGSIVKQFVAKRKPPYISFSGKSSDAGRIKLYDMIAKNIGRYLPEYKLINSGNVAPDDIMAYADKVYTFKRVAQESVTEAPKMRPFQIVGGYGFETQIHKFEAPSQADAERYAEKWAVQNVDLIPGKAKRYFVRPITKFVQQPSYWTTLGDSIEEEKKPKKPKTIIDGALKTLIAKGRSEDEAIADLKKEIDSKFYDLDESDKDWSPMELAIMEGGHLLDEYDESLDETLKKVKGEWALVSRKNPKKVLQYYHGSGHPSKDWVSKVERRVHSFESIMEDESTKPRVYLDMDGVLADFFGEWSKLAQVDHYKDINNPEENLQLVRDHPTFWVDLPLLPNAKALIQTVINNYGEYRICSKPLEGDARSKPGKMEWIQKHLGDMMPVEVVLTANKAAFATQDGVPSILVDDFGVNIKSWRAAGGIGIKYDDSAFPQVAKILTSIAKSGVVK